jgi:hypothetical protein
VERGPVARPRGDGPGAAGGGRRVGRAREGDWLTLLGPGGVISGREVGHDGGVDPGHLLSELQAHYEAFGYRPNTEEPPDHVSVEAGFVGYLRLREAYARASGLEEAARTTSAVTARFLDEHVLQRRTARSKPVS